MSNVPDSGRKRTLNAALHAGAKLNQKNNVCHWTEFP